MTAPLTMVLPGLRPGRYLTLQERYEEWRATPEGQFMYDAVVKNAHRLHARGFTRYSMKALWETARYQRGLTLGPDAQGFKLNNNWTSRVAREVMANEPDLAGFFETRDLRAA